MTKRYRSKSLNERREIVFTLQKNGFNPTSYTLRDINDPSDFDEYPIIVIDDDGEIGLVGSIPSIPYDSDPFESKEEIYKYYEIKDEKITMYQTGTLIHYFI